MLISLSKVLSKYNLNPKSVIHVGAHWAEEHEDYVNNGIEKFVYIEPCKEAFAELKDKFYKHKHTGGLYEKDGVKFMRLDYGNVAIINVACGSSEGVMAMYVSHDNQGQSNSLLEPSLHLTQHPNVVFNDAEAVSVVTLDSLKLLGDFLVMDCQGYEGEILKGATETLKKVNIIYTECNRGQTYKGNMEIEEMDMLLSEQGFKRVETYWPSPNWTWGDAIYVNTKFL